MAEPVAESAVAVVGMSGRFPGARSVAELWRNLCDGVDAVRALDEAEVLAAGVDPALARHPGYVKAASTLDDVDLFDAEFFGFTPREAEAMDPQHRLFLDCAWEALEEAGCDPTTFPGLIGVFAGSAFCTYLLRNLYANPAMMQLLGDLQVATGNERDSLTTMVSYKLGLKGPSLAVQTFCSTSLVAVHLAVQSLLNFECDLALAGGVAINVPQASGYLYQEGGVLSPDGRCRSFDARAQGMIIGNGVGLVALRRLEDAHAEGDRVRAVIRGSAVNNDGSLRAGFTAPGLDGQAAVIVEALASAGVEPESLAYYEAHGTGTPLGDSIELAALMKAFRGRPARKRSCALGSVKSNLGHLDRAAGVTGLIKTVLAVESGLLPPSLHFERTSDDIDLSESPFYVNTRLSPWVEGAAPRRAGVSSFGLGGTNAHVVVEEAPPPLPTSAGRPAQLLVLSARTEAALEAMTDNLARSLRAAPELDLADAAFTLCRGRALFNHRRVVVGSEPAEVATALETRDPRRLATALQQGGRRPVAFLLPGLGDHYAGMGEGLYRGEPVFRAAVDRCAEVLAPILGRDLRTLLYPPAGAAGASNPAPRAEAGADLRRLLHRSAEAAPAGGGALGSTALAQPATFVVEYALAQLFLEWGIRPDALLGYSLGEYVAACLAGVMTLEQALAVVARRAAAIDRLPAGAMLAVALGEDEAAARLGGSLSIAAVNAPALSVVTGPEPEVDRLAAELAAAGIAASRLATAHPFHSPALAAVAGDLTRLLSEVELRPPEIPFVSNLTGTWITAEQATDVAYWVRQMCEPVRFAAGVETLWEGADRVLLEVGPGRTLTSFALQSAAGDRPREAVALSSLRAALDPQDDQSSLLSALGRLWLAGVQVDWKGFYRHQRRRRTALPTYPFERRRFWVDPSAAPLAAAPPAGRRPDLADWFYLPAWRPSAIPDRRPSALPDRRPSALPDSRPSEAAVSGDGGGEAELWLVFAGGSSLADRLAGRLAESPRRRVVVVERGQGFAALGDGRFAVAPGRPEDYAALLAALGQRPRRVVHAWSLGDDLAASGAGGFEPAQEVGFHSLRWLARALAATKGTDPIRIAVLADGLFRVSGAERLRPERATLLGPCRVLPQEFLDLTLRLLDVEAPEPGSWQEEEVVDRLLADLGAERPDLAVAYRGLDRFVQHFAPVRLEGREDRAARLREGGVYLITGGLGGVGLHLAEHLASRLHARLVLTGRAALPERGEWESWIAEHPEDDPTAARLRRLLAVEAAGGEVLTLAANVADEAAMRRVLARVDERFGRLDGVIHAAGCAAAEGFGGAADLDRAGCELHFEPKVRGVQVLARLLAERRLDFCLLMSSLSSVLGGLGFVAYTAANAFMDAFAQAQRGVSRTPWISVDWDTWKLREDQHAKVGATVAQFEMTPGEGAEVLERILSHDLGAQVVESTGDLEARIAQWVRLDASRGHGDALAAGSPARHARPQLATPFVAPRSEVERAVAAIWESLLGIEEVGVDDNFFDLGGHSLLATQLFSRLRDAFDVELSLRNLFETPTVAALAEKLAMPAAAPTRRPPAIQPEPRDRPLPLSFAQQRLWLVDQLEPGSSAYNRPGALRLLGEIDVAALERALSGVVERHEVLRTRFVRLGDEPVQAIEPPRPLRLPVVDLAGLPAAVAEASATELARRQAQTPFDLERGPLLRTDLLRIAATRHVLCFTLHHIVSDGWSEAVLVSEAVALYEAFGQGRPSPLAPLAVQYGDFAAWQRRWLDGEVLETQLAYWRRQLEGAPAELRLPVGGASPGARTLSGGSLVRQVASPRLAELNRLSRQEDVTLFATLLTAFAVLLHHASGQDDLVIGTPVAGRNVRETEGLIGFFANTLVLRAELSGDPTLLQLLARMRETTLEAQAHQDLPFERLVDALRPQRHLDRSPLFQVWFVLQSTAIEPPVVHGLAFEDLELRSHEVRHDLLLDVMERPDGLRLLFEYRRDLLAAEVVERLADHYATVLELLVTAPDTRVAEVVARLAAADREREAWQAEEYATAVASGLGRARRRLAVTAAASVEDGYEESSR